jgi:hypothetical protein
MMKKNFSYLAFILLTICLMGFVFGRTIPTSVLHTASEPHPVLGSANLTVNETVPLALSAQPAAVVIIALISVLVALMATVPLLLDDPALRKGAGIYLGVNGSSDDHAGEDGSAGRLDCPTHSLSGGELGDSPHTV